MIPPMDRALVAALCLARAGLRVDADKSYLIESRLGPVARREGFTSPEALIEALREKGDERLGWATVEAMVLPECEFFRDHAVFDHLVEEVLPQLIRARGGQPVRVWSAACGSGQEIYSLAMLLAENAMASQVELFASDISERSLEKAQAGIYSQFEVQRGLPARKLVRHFEKIGEAFVLAPRLRQMVRWRRINLLDDLSRFGQFDLVLCRNVLNSLAPEAHGRVLGSLRRTLAPGGQILLSPKDYGGPELTSLTPQVGLYGATDDAARAAA